MATITEPPRTAQTPVDPHAHAERPPGAREFSFRAVFVAMIIAAVIGGSYPYVVLKLGFGPSISVVSAFFGFLALGLFFKDYNRWENNIVQTAGTAAGSTAFLCTLMAAFDMLRADPTLHFPISLTPLETFAWLTSAGLLGTLLSVPLRRHFVVEEKLTFADGIAAGETLIVLDSRGPDSRKAAHAMGIATIVSAAIMTIREDARLIAKAWYRIPEMLALGPTGASMNVGVSWSLLSAGAGMLVGMRINISMLIGVIVGWVIAPPLLLQNHVVSGMVRREVLLWVMWPATGMLVAGGLTALVLRWRLLVQTFRGLRGAKLDSGDFPMRWVIGGSIVCAIALIIVQKVSFGQPIWMTALAIVFSIPLMLAGLRVLGETNWGPVSPLSNMMQGIFGVIAPGHVAVNMVASGVTGSVASQSEGLMQDYKTGDMIGSTPRHLTYAQLIAIPIGAATVAFVYPLLRDTYGIGGDHGLQSPISTKWAGFAKLLSAGVSALPHGAVQALVIGTALGIVLTILESTRWRRWLPSPTGLGIGMLVPGSAVISMFLGGVAAEIWKRGSPKSAERYLVPTASGFIAGEAIIAVVIPILVVIGLVKLQP